VTRSKKYVYAKNRVVLEENILAMKGLMCLCASIMEKKHLKGVPDVPGLWFQTVGIAAKPGISLTGCTVIF